MLHTWSLGVEEQFYLVWPVLLVFLLRHARRYLLPGMALCLLLSVGAAEAVVRVNQPLAYYMLPFRAFELLAGAVLAVGAGRLAKPQGAAADAALALGLILILFAVVAFDPDTPIPGAAALVPTLGAVLAIWAGQAPRVGAVLRNPVCVWMGLVSYSLYLVHWPVFVFWRYVTSHTWATVEKLALLLVCVGLAAAMHRWVETPWRRAPARPNGDRRFLATIAGFAALIAVPGAALVAGPKTAPGAALTVMLAPAGETPPQRNIGFDSPGHGRLRLVHYAAPQERARALLIGDSHAGHLAPGLIRTLTQAGISLDISMMPGCPPLFGVWRDYGGDPALASRETICRERKEGWRAMAAMPHYDAVLIAARWQPLFEPETGTGSARRRSHLVDFGAPNMPRTPERSRALFTRALDETVSTITATGKPVVVFGQVPSPGANVSRCTVMAFGMAEAASGRCRGVDRAAQAARGRFANMAIAARAARDPLMLAILPETMMCDTRACMRHLPSGDATYRDDNHLTHEAAIWLAGRMARETGLTAFILGAAPGEAAGPTLGAAGAP